MKLAIAQMVFGVFIVVGYFYLLVCPVFLSIVPALGVAVLFCGIAQFAKARG